MIPSDDLSYKMACNLLYKTHNLHSIFHIITKQTSGKSTRVTSDDKVLNDKRYSVLGK
jgi:hypothetical protein